MYRKALALFFFFSVLFAGLSQVNAQESLNLTVAADRQAYYGSNVVTINGALKNGGVSVNGLVGIQVQDSKGNILVFRTVTSGSPSDSLPIAITAAYLSDSSGVSKSEIAASRLGYFCVNLINYDQTAHSMLVTVNLFDCTGTPIGEISSNPSLGALQIDPETTISSIQIPSWAHSGVGFGYANVYTDLPSKGGVPMANEVKFTFNIISGSGSKSANLPTPQKSVGLYALAFRLPTSGSIDGVYSITASAKIIGAVTQSTQFKGVFGDFNSDGAVDYADAIYFVSSYVSFNKNNPAYNALTDLDHDGAITYNDAVQFINCYIAYGVL